MKPVMFCKEDQRQCTPLAAQDSMKCAALLRRDSENRMPLLAMMPTGIPPEVREAGHQRAAA